MNGRFITTMTHMILEYSIFASLLFPPKSRFGAFEDLLCLTYAKWFAQRVYFTCHWSKQSSLVRQSENCWANTYILKSPGKDGKGVLFLHFSLDFRSFQKFLERKTTHSQICNLKATMLGASEISCHCFFDLRFSWHNFWTLVTSRIPIILRNHVLEDILYDPLWDWRIFSSKTRKRLDKRQRRAFCRYSIFFFKEKLLYLPSLEFHLGGLLMFQPSTSKTSNGYQRYPAFLLDPKFEQQIGVSDTAVRNASDIELRSMFTVFRCCCGECNSIEGGQNEISKNVGMITW